MHLSDEAGLQGSSLNGVKINAELFGVIEALKELQGEGMVPRNVKNRIQQMILTLECCTDVSLGVDRAQQELDEIADDINLQPYARTQIWNIISLLEKL